MQRHYDSAQGLDTKPSSTTYFDRWLERTRRKGRREMPFSGEYYSRVDGSNNADPLRSALQRSFRDTQPSRIPSPMASSRPHSPEAVYASPSTHSRLNDLEGMLFTQSHFNRLYSSEFPLRTTATDDEYLSHTMHNDSETYYESKAGPTRSQTPLPTRRPLQLAPQNSALYESFLGATAGQLDERAFPPPGGVTRGEPIKWAVREPFEAEHEPFGSYATPAFAPESDRYIAQLESEVQTLTRELGEREREAAAATVLRNGMALQLAEVTRRRDIERDERDAFQNLTYSFLRNVSMQRVLEERSCAMELNTQISLLKHELKLSEAMHERQAAATASSTLSQQLEERRREEQELARAVTTTVRGLLESEYARLSDMVAEMPSKMQSCIAQQQQQQQASATRSGSKSEEDAAGDGSVATSRLYDMIESALAAAAAASAASTTASSHLSPTGSGASGSNHAKETVVRPSSAPTVTASDATRLLSLVSRTNEYHETMLDLYCDAVDAKFRAAQYETHLARLINEKQSALTWAALYEDKKDEVKHLKEKLMELRGELRTATGTTSPTTIAVASPRGVNNGMYSSFAGSTSSQSYEAYAAPYVPPPKRGQRHQNTNTAASNTVPPLGEAAATSHSSVTKPIQELREEARRLGAHPAVHYPPPVTSPSPSMPSLFVSRSPAEVEQTVLMAAAPPLSVPHASAPPASQRGITDNADSPLTSPVERPAVPQLNPAMTASLTTLRSAQERSPTAAVIRSFDPHTRTRSDTSSEASSLSSPVPPRVVATKEKKSSFTGTRRAKPAVADKLAVQRKKAALPESSLSSVRSTTSPSPSATPVRPSLSPKATAVTLKRLPAPIEVDTSSATSSPVSSSLEERPAAKAKAANAARHGSPSAASSPSPAAKTKAAVVHNSFDDDEDTETDRRGSSSAAAQPHTAKPEDKKTMASLTTPSSRVDAKASRKEKAGTQVPAPVVMAGSSTTAATSAAARLEATVRAIEHAKKDSSDDDADTSSLTLTTTSLASAKLLKSRTKRVGAKTSNERAAASAKPSLSAPTKAAHGRKSSFDDDGSDTESSSPAVALQRNAAGGATPTTTRTVPPRADATTTPPAASAVPAANANKPSKLKFPTW